MDRVKELVGIAMRVRALAQNGLVYSLSEYDTERYTELLELSSRIISRVGDCSEEEVMGCLTLEKDYVTPKVDVRAVVFNERDEILLVREKADGKWALPGGWADVGCSPKETAVKEVKEETGLEVDPVRLLAVHDGKFRNRTEIYYYYKIFILCDIRSGSFSTAFDILDKGFFAQDALPPLSEGRVVKEQVDLMFEYRKNPEKQAEVD